MNGEFLSLKTAEKLQQCNQLIKENDYLKNENNRLKEQVKRLRQRLKVEEALK